MSYEFDVQRTVNQAIAWIKDWFDENGSMKNAIVGISGGVDSAVVAALCVGALGENRVIGVLMPNIYQDDILDAMSVCGSIGIMPVKINIGRAYTEILMELANNGIQASDQTRINLPPRLRMTALYAIAQSKNGMVANTCNLSESYIGYDTLFGDQCGSFSPIGQLTKTEVLEMARYLQLPRKIWLKAPSDGLCGHTDEESFGFTYKELDNYLRNNGVGVSENVISEIERMHEASEFKRQMIRIDTFMPGL